MKQQDRSDCGVACLASIIQYHGGEETFERLREISGTSQEGTTLLGLYQAASAVGFVAEGLEADRIEDLESLTSPAILHVLVDGKLPHYVVFYGFQKNGSLIIGDPDRGLSHYSPTELLQIWSGKKLLKLVPSTTFKLSKSKQAEKRAWIKSLVKEDTTILLLAIFFGVVISVLGLSMVTFTQKLIDDILPSGETTKLIFAVAIVFLLMLFRNLISYSRSVFLLQQATGFNTKLNQSFYSRLVRLPKSFFDSRRTGELISRLNDTRKIQTVISVIAAGAIIDALVAITAIVFVFFYTAVAGYVFLIAIPVYLALLLSFNKRIISSQRQVMRSHADAESYYIDSIQGMTTIKSFNKEESFKKQNAILYETLQKRIFDLGKLNIRFGLISESIGITFTFSIVALASFMVLNKTLQIGEMVAILTLAGTIIPSINRLAATNSQLQEAILAFNRMHEFVSIQPEADTEPLPHDKKTGISLSIQNLCFRFAGRSPLLKNVSMDLRQNEITVLLGESGAGKSTIIQLLLRFYREESGEILVNGQSINKDSISSWRNQVGVVPQEIKIFNENLLYNITLSKDLNEHKRALDMCGVLGFDRYFEKLPQGYATLLGEEGINVSGGQRQIIAFARALFKTPEFLILDEATSAMDRNTEDFILRSLETLKLRMTIFVVTHKIRTAARADKVYILEDGCITTSGSPHELMLSKNLYSESVLDQQMLIP